MSHELTPRQQADFVHEKGVKSVMSGLLAIGLGVGYYFMCVWYESDPPERINAIFYVLHGVLGKVAGAALFALIGLALIGKGLSSIAKAKKLKAELPPEDTA